MKEFLKRLTQPSSFAGYSALVYSIPALIANPADVVAWGATLTALGAVLKQEQAMKVLKDDAQP